MNPICKRATRKDGSVERTIIGIEARSLPSWGDHLAGVIDTRDIYRISR
ncbi:MAG: hypothetical protein ACI87E_004014, partial [Mariniblastus sp.]